MTPTEYLDQLQRFTRARDAAGLLAFEQKHLTDALLDEMTPQQRRLAYSANHVAARSIGESALDPPSGVLVDDEVEVAS